MTAPAAEEKKAASTDGSPPEKPAVNLPVAEEVKPITSQPVSVPAPNPEQPPSAPLSFEKRPGVPVWVWLLAAFFMMFCLLNIALLGFGLVKY